MLAEQARVAAEAEAVRVEAVRVEAEAEKARIAAAAERQAAIEADNSRGFFSKLLGFFGFK